MPSGTDLANLFTIEGDVPADTSVWALTGWNRFICALTD